MTEEENREIREEERFPIEQLDDLVIEFVERYSELNQPLLEFFEGYWANQMEEILDESGPIDEEEVRRVKDLGVVLEK
jgi:hypothetical protein